MVASQEVLLGTTGQTLSIRHDALSREAYTPGVLLALDKLQSLPPGLSSRPALRSRPGRWPQAWP
jgi:dihydrodipicolinate reductase